MYPYELQRTGARRIRLNSADQFQFDDAPDYIVNAFFAKCTYKKRITVVTFCFVNGISYDGLISLIRWTDFEEKDRIKICKLWLDCLREPYKSSWYSYNCHLKCVTYLSGSRRLRH